MFDDSVVVVGVVVDGVLDKVQFLEDVVPGDFLLMSPVFDVLVVDLLA